MQVKNNLVLSSDYIVYIRDFALSKGIPAKILVSDLEAGLDILLNPPQRVSAQTFHKLGFNLFNALQNPYEGVLEFGQGMILSLHGTLGVAIQGASNLNEVIRLAAAYYLTRANFRLLQQLDGPEYSCVRLTEVVDEYDKYFCLAELVSFEHAVVKLLSHHELPSSCIIHMKSGEPDNFPWHRVKGYQIKFTQAYNQLLVPKQWMNLPINSIDPELAELAKNQCQQIMEELSPQDLVNEVRQRLKKEQDKNISLKEMAQKLHLSSSTLQRRLREFNTTFKDIKLEVRLLAAKQLLFSGEYTVEQISERLGFSDASSFTKSFKAFSGDTPAVYRKKHAG